MRSSFLIVAILLLNTLTTCSQTKSSFNISGEEIDLRSKRPVGWSFSFNKDQEKVCEIKLASTTARADGDVSSIILPGGISTIFSGLGIFYPDNTKTQRIGVKINEEIRPTIKGITEGKDELLERAKQMIL